VQHGVWGVEWKREKWLSMTKRERRVEKGAQHLQKFTFFEVLAISLLDF